MTIVKRLKRGFFCIALMSCSIGVFCAWYAHDISVEFNHLASETLPSVKALETVRFAGLRVVSSTSEFAFLHNEKAGKLKPEGALSEEKDLITSGHALFTQAYATYQKICASHLHEQATQQKIKAAFHQLARTSHEIITTKISGGGGESVLALKEKFEKEEVGFLNIIDEAINHKYLEMADGKKRILASADNAFIGIVCVSLALLFFTYSYGRWLANSINQPITELCRASNEIGLGRFNTRIPNRSSTERTSGDINEIELLVGNFNRMVEELEQSMVDRGILDLIINKFDNGVIITNQEGLITFANQAAAQLLDCSRSQLIGQSATKFFQYLAVVTQNERNAHNQEPIKITTESTVVIMREGRKLEITTTILAPSNKGGGKVSHLLTFREKAFQ